MNAATADPPVLPADLAAAFDAAGAELVVRHPRTGARLRLVGPPASAPVNFDADADGPPPTTTLLEDVEASDADIAAGRTRPIEEWFEGRNRHLVELLEREGIDPEGHIPPDVLAEVYAARDAERRAGVNR